MDADQLESSESKMPGRSFRARTIPGVIFAVLVIIFAMGNFDVGLYPYGTAVWVRPLFSLFGIAGALMLLAGIGWWRVVLPIWCVVQSVVIAVDVSGPWFYQGMMVGWTYSRSVRNSNMLTSYEAHGFNFAGVLLLVVLGIIMVFRLHPRLRWRITTRQAKCVGAVALLLIVASVAQAVWWHARISSASYVVDLNVPAVPIYYKDQLLGRTPLIITPEKVREWKLPLSAADLKMYSMGWADTVILSDGKTKLPLYARAPWPFAHYVDTFRTPWGERCRMHIGSDPGKREQTGFLFPRADLRDEPILTISLLDSGRVKAGGPLKIHCVLTNPTGRMYEGARAEIERLCFSWDNRTEAKFGTWPAEYRLKAKLPKSWNQLPPGARYSADLDFDAPLKPGNYELFCTWFLFRTQEGSEGTGSCYSNMLSLPVRPAATTTPDTAPGLHSTRTSPE